MVNGKGLEPSVADAIGKYVTHHGGMEILEKLEADEKLGNSKIGKAFLNRLYESATFR